MRVYGAAAVGAKVAFPVAYFEVARVARSANGENFSIRLRDRGLPETGLYIYVRTPDRRQRRVAVHEFSCPTAEGTCAFAS
jgi:hypothetical protein